MTSFVPNKPHFFKPVLPSTKHGLLIPISFIEKYLKGIKLDKAELRRESMKWEVKIKNKRVLEQGWPKFVEDNSIQEGHFLVFRHEGDLVFEVLHFDRSTLLKPPPLTSFSSNPPLPRVKREKILSDDDDDDNDHHNSQISPLPNSEKNRFHGSNVKAKRKRGECSTKFGLEGETESLSRNSALRSGFPYVTGTLTAHNISSSILYFPMKFARANRLTKNCEVIMKDESGRSFCMLLKRRGSHVFISRGFNQFIAANSLKEGDSYIVYLLQNGNQPLLNFLRLNKTPQKKQHRVEDLYYSSTLTESNIQLSNLNVPMEFARRNGLTNRDCKMIMRDEKGRSFQMSLKCSGRQVRICKGFNHFIASNGLKQGDPFILRLLHNGNKPLMNFVRLTKFKKRKQELGNFKHEETATNSHHNHQQFNTMEEEILL